VCDVQCLFLVPSPPPPPRPLPCVLVATSLTLSSPEVHPLPPAVRLGERSVYLFDSFVDATNWAYAYGALTCPLVRGKWNPRGNLSPEERKTVADINARRAATASDVDAYGTSMFLKCSRSGTPTGNKARASSGTSCPFQIAISRARSNKNGEAQQSGDGGGVQLVRVCVLLDLSAQCCLSASSQPMYSLLLHGRAFVAVHSTHVTRRPGVPPSAAQPLP
jgi:hypothetical protein